jgi:hypothetical protein
LLHVEAAPGQTRHLGGVLTDQQGGSAPAGGVDPSLVRIKINEGAQKQSFARPRSSPQGQALTVVNVKEYRTQVRPAQIIYLQHHHIIISPSGPIMTQRQALTLNAARSP